MNNKLISIIIPVYNVSQYIERCILSVLNQSYNNLEIIIIDDCSPDDSMGIVKSILEQKSDEKRVKIIYHEKNKGLSGARNTGIKAATGEYIFFLDSDDEIVYDCIQKLVSNSEDFELIMGGVKLNSGEKYFENKVSLFYNNHDIRNAYFDNRIYDMAWNKLIKRDFIIKNELFFMDGLIHEDSLWTFQVCMCCNSLRIVDDLTYIYHIREGALSTNISIKNVKHQLIGLNLITETLLKENLIADLNVKCFLINYEFLIKKTAVKKINISFDDFKRLEFPSQKYSFNKLSLKAYVQNCLIKLPIFIQYKLLRLYYLRAF